jgi:hypothetical protein
MRKGKSIIFGKSEGNKYLSGSKYRPLQQFEEDRPLGRWVFKIKPPP